MTKMDFDADYFYDYYHYSQYVLIFMHFALQS